MIKAYYDMIVGLGHLREQLKEGNQLAVMKNGQLLAVVEYDGLTENIIEVTFDHISNALKKSVND